MNVLFLDDNADRTAFFQSRFPRATCVSSAKDCIFQLETKNWDVIFLDHDLNEIMNEEDYLEEHTGMEVVRYICSNKLVIPHIVVHSCNYYKSAEMYETLLNENYNVTKVPFGFLFSGSI
jgi:hypothetical protein